MSTPHIRAEKGDFAESILLPGDPLRAKFIAENYLEDPRLVTDVRNVLGYTGTYKGEEISVMGTGMGCPSIGIYSYELINFYGVKNLIRVGSCGAFSEKLKLYDVILGQGACTNSNFATQYHLPGTMSAIADFELLHSAYKSAEELGVNVTVGNVLSSDIFYYDDPDEWKLWQKMGVLAVEMEAFALYCNALRAGARALTILTVSDSIVTKEETTPEERQKSFTTMMEIALEAIRNLGK